MQKIKSTLLLLFLALSAHAANQVTDSENITKQFKFSSQSTANLIRVFNVYGSIDVAGHDGDEIEVEAYKEVRASDAKTLAEGKDEINLAFVEKGHELWVYLESPFTYIDEDSGKIWHSDTCWRHDDCSKKVARKHYRYHMDIKIKVPHQTNIALSTINDGDISVSGIAAQEIKVNNINGAIDMVDVAGAETHVNAINKDINIAYANNPTADSSYESINGDINISYADEPDAEVVYQTLHGDMYTSYQVAFLPPAIAHKRKQKENGIRYQLNANSRLKLGQGGPEYRFKTLNGDIKLQ
ncbi:DUF4097 family beta strand repeat-containing protein [Marinicella sp. S1101]|uniref:DUF4097 family beta strand repeat-containing protein n=1 Tax=Marinicella marina TaxID=2996016 RepID=UPI002260A83A|nr:DUF4097 family beta strand repeat-containing protein [Marinicella marina]MCX7553981.1 DUF4097 family beta strand repeat-containing protein [Marinicella marina]MDJ1140474.1 DUF4097 family beta strand repeat-containing protein [Marinicella marina]